MRKSPLDAMPVFSTATQLSSTAVFSFVLIGSTSCDSSSLLCDAGNDKQPASPESSVRCCEAVRLKTCGVYDAGVAEYHPVAYYRRVVVLPPYFADRMILLHANRVDWNVTYWVNGILVGNHLGGFDAHAFDITMVSICNPPFVRKIHPQTLRHSHLSAPCCTNVNVTTLCPSTPVPKLRGNMSYSPHLAVRHLYATNFQGDLKLPANNCHAIIIMSWNSCKEDIVDMLMTDLCSRT